MSGSHYTLDRDRPENQNPMDVVKEKACRRCGTVKPNDFRYFGKKLWMTRHTFTTNEVCIDCQKKQVSDSMRAKWKARKIVGHDYEAEQLRMARSIHVANEALAAQRAQAAVKVLDQDPDDAEGIRRIVPE